ncbi:MAG: immunoglobulin-like domain-containing protein, partial [Candidatus Hydrogenedentota bacterium]
MGNGLDGVLVVHSSQSIEVGGTAAGQSNVIAHNGTNGVELDSTANRVSIRRNAIHTNGSGGIAIAAGGNGGLVAPTITAIGSVTGVAPAATEVEIFTDDEDEGRVYLDTVVSGGGFSSTIDISALQGEFLTATATDDIGNTSAFSSAFQVPVFPLLTREGPGNGFYIAGQTINVTATIDYTSTAPITSFLLTETIPAGWTFDSIAFVSSALAAVPQTGQGGPLVFSWTVAPAFPLTLTYRLVVPAAETATVQISGHATFDFGAGGIDGGIVTTEIVPDTAPPEITLVNGPSLSIECGDTFVDPGFTALDNGNIDLTADVNVAGTVDGGNPGLYSLTYSVTDASGNLAQAVRSVTVEDTTAPVLTLLGENPVILELNQAYVEPGATADDACEGDLSGLIQTAGVVDTSSAGVYLVTYTVQDAANNVASEQRSIQVGEAVPPTVALGAPSTLLTRAGPVTLAADYTDAATISLNPDDVIVTATDTAAVATIEIAGTGLVQRTITLSGLSGDGELRIRVAAGSAQDAFGNPAAASNESGPITVDNTVPVLSVLGMDPVFVEQGVPYSDAGAVATDTVDGDVAVTVEGLPINTNVLDDYVVTYRAVDTAGNESLATRTVLVRSGETTTYYVDAAATTLGDGSSERPFATISEAIDRTEGDRGERILVRGGIYAERFALKSFTILRSDEGAFHTIISGEDANADVVTLADGCALVGFTVIGGGSANLVRVTQDSEAAVRNCVFTRGAVGISADAGAEVDFNNNVLYELASKAIVADSTAFYSALRSCIFQNNALDFDPDLPRAGGFNHFPGTDLVFVDADELNFHLRADVPARDTGDDRPAFADRDGTRNDAGADGGPYGVRDFAPPQVVTTSSGVEGEVRALEGEAPFAVSLDGNDSSDEFGVLSYLWDFDLFDNVDGDSAARAALHTYEEAGTFLGSLRVTDTNGNVGERTFTVRVSEGVNQPPDAVASVSPNSGPAPLPVIYEGEGVDPDGGAVTYEWIVKDQTPATSPDFGVTYAESTPSGSYRAALLVTDDEGAQSPSLVFLTLTDDALVTSGVVNPNEDTEVVVGEPGDPLDGASVFVPAGASGEPIVVTISQVAADPLPLGQAFGVLVDFGPSGYVFSAPVTVRLPHPAETPHDDIVEIFWYDETKDAWSTDGVINVRHLDGAPDHFIEFQTNHFTVFSTKSLVPRTITGSVISAENGGPIEGAMVSLNEQLLDVTTDDTGLFSFGVDLPPSEYEVAVSAPGFEPDAQNYLLTDSSVGAVSFELVPSGGEGEGEGEG